MRITPINNNLRSKQAPASFNWKFKAGITAAFIMASTFSYCQNREAWDTFIKEERKERSDNLRIKPEIKDFNSQESAINYAFDRILVWLNKDIPKEYCVFIDNKTHNILTECRGQELSVTPRETFKMITKEKISNNFSYTSIHGHPEQEIGGTTTFSPTDVETFLTSDSCTEEFVISKDRKYCRLKKEENYRKPTEEELKKILEDYERVCAIAKPWRKVVRDENNNVVFDFIDYPSMHDALDRFLKPFGISYLTTYGTYNTFDDVYKNGYFQGFNDGELLTTSFTILID